VSDDSRDEELEREWASDLNAQAADEWERLYRVTLRERDEARAAAQEALGLVDRRHLQVELCAKYQWLKDPRLGEVSDGERDVGGGGE